MAGSARQGKGWAGTTPPGGGREPARELAGDLADPLIHHLIHPLAQGRQAFLALAAQESEHRTPFLWLPLAFGLGILIYFNLAREPLWWHGPALAMIALVPALGDGGWRQRLGIGLLFVALGFSAAAWRTQRVATPMLGREMIARVQGFVETLDAGQDRLRLTIRPVSIEGLPPKTLPFALKIGVPAAGGVAPGDFIHLRARLAPPAEAAMPGGYDFRRDAFFKGIGGVGYGLGSPVPATAPQEPPRDLVFYAMIDSGRNWLTGRIAQAIGGQAGALAAALVTGKRGLISEATNADLRAAGLYHIVSISGIHMVLAAGVLFWSLRAFLAAIPGLALCWPIKKIAALLAMGGAIFYNLFSGSEVATERSLIMTLVMLGAILADRPALTMRNLALSALLVLARKPESLLGPSFQMSFAAVACLIGANRIWREWRRHRPPREGEGPEKLLRKLAFTFMGIGATTLVATLATGPFSAYHFHRVNPFGLLGNALALPLVSGIVMPAAVIGTLLSPLDLDWIIWRIMGEGVGGVLLVAEWVGGMQNASYPVARFTPAAFALMVAALLLFAHLQTRLRALCLLPLTLLLVVPLHPPPPEMVIDPSGKSALIRSSGGHYRLLAASASNRFTLAQWLPALGDGRLPRDAMLREGVRCDEAGCALAKEAGQLKVALSLTLDALREDCERADIVITPLVAPGACAAGLKLDHQHFQRMGAAFITRTADGGLAVQGALEGEAHRPWRQEPATDKTAGLAQAPLARLLRAENWPGRGDGRRLFGLLPPEPPRPAETAEPPEMAEMARDATAARGRASGAISRQVRRAGANHAGAPAEDAAGGAPQEEPAPPDPFAMADGTPPGNFPPQEAHQ